MLQSKQASFSYQKEIIRPTKMYRKLSVLLLGLDFAKFVQPAQKTTANLLRRRVWKKIENAQPQCGKQVIHSPKVEKRADKMSY